MSCRLWVDAAACQYTTASLTYRGLVLWLDFVYSCKLFLYSTPYLFWALQNDGNNTTKSWELKPYMCMFLCVFFNGLSWVLCSVDFIFLTPHTSFFFVTLFHFGALGITREHYSTKGETFTPWITLMSSPPTTKTFCHPNLLCWSFLSIVFSAEEAVFMWSDSKEPVDW